MAFSYFFPASFQRVASRAGRVSFVLAASVAFLFPDAAGSGTDTETARWTTVGALAAAGALLVLARGSWLVAGLGFAALAAGAVLAPAPWLLAYAAIACLYVASALVPRETGGAPPAESAPPPPDAAAPGTPAPHDDDATPRHEGRELVDSIAVALVLALVVREFAFEAFKIPTGSMQPTIWGDSGPRSDESLLSDVSRLFRLAEPAPGRRGDRLLAFKGRFTDPERWQIVVFKFPLYRGTNYIKRLVGLPGEHLRIVDGDLYVDGAIVSKPDSVQEVMWQRVGRRNDFDPRCPLWNGVPEEDFDEDPNGGWTLDRTAARLDAPHGAPRWIVSRQAYVADLRGSFDVEGLDLAEGGSLLVRIEGRTRTVTLEVTRDAMRLTAPGRDRVDLRVGGAGRLGRDFRLGLAYADRVVRVSVDGRQVARMETADVVGSGGERDGRFSVGGVDARGTFRGFTLEADVQYTSDGSHQTEFRIPDDAFVMFGDNTGSSRDSREWRANLVTTKDGRKFVAPNVARLDDEHDEQTWHPRGDGGVDFVDADGIQRSFSKDEIEEIEHSVHQPFVLRRDIVGPAFLVFFPFPPFGEFRPRFLR